jgi:histidine ammonia-lyase
LSGQRVVLTPAPVTVEDLARVALERADVEVDESIWSRVRASRAVVERALDRGKPVYGLNTGLGPWKDQAVPLDILIDYQRRIVFERAGATGTPLPDEQVRALMFARIVGLAQGGSGATPGALEVLVRMLNAGVHPLVGEQGSLGASDIGHMAVIADVAIGRGRARVDGEILPGSEALARAGIEPYELQPKDGLAMVSANGASIGVGALTVLEAERVARLADMTAALALEAASGNLSPFDEEVARAKPFPGQIEAAKHVRELLSGSYLEDPGTALSVQDPLSFRVVAQVHGALRDQIAYARRAVEIELNAIDDNPLASIEQDTLLSNGNFHPMVLALAFEALRIGLAHTGMISERRIRHVFAPGRQTSPDFTPTAEKEASPSPLERLPNVTFVTPILALVELKHLAAPVTLECPAIFGVEDHHTLAPTAVLFARRSLRQLETVLALEALAATKALDQRDDLPQLGAGTRPLYEAVRGVYDEIGPDASPTEVVESARRSVKKAASGP